VKSRRTKWITRGDMQVTRARSGQQRQTEQRMKPLHTRSHCAAHLLRRRRTDQHWLAVADRHLRAVAREGDDGLRCWDCQHIPLHPWEPVLPEPNDWHL
jgi:hypothetical protein